MLASVYLLCVILLNVNKDSIRLSCVDYIYFISRIIHTFAIIKYHLSSIKARKQVQISRQLDSFICMVLLSNNRDILIELIYDHTVAIFGDESWLW